MTIDHASARAGAGAVLRPLEEPPSLLDADRYTDPARYQREVTQVLLKSWVMVGPSSSVAQPTDFVVWEQLGQSVVITRQLDGTLAAWHNVCQHRGARVVEGAGSCATGIFKCPWHGFTYDLTGRVMSVPQRKSFDPALLEGLRAPAVHVAERYGLVWVCLTEPPGSLDEYLGELVPQLDWYGLDDFDARYSQEWHISANWKAVLDGFLETWHVPFTHKDTLGGMVMWRGAKLKDLEPHSMMTIPVKGKDGVPLESPSGDPRESQICHYLAFPNTIFSCFPTHVQLFQAWPVGPQETVFKAWNLFGPTPEGMSDEEWSARADRRWASFQDVAAEDLEVLNELGRSYTSLGFRRNMFNEDEGRLSAFHRAVDARASVVDAVP